MYYKGSPFEPINITTEEDALAGGGNFYKAKDEEVPFADKIIEVSRKNSGVVLIIYVKAKGYNEALMRYHKDTYGAAMSFHVEDYIAPHTIHTTIFVNLAENGTSIYHYDEHWRLKVEHAYDKGYKMIEYRESYYNGDEDLPYEEKIFYAQSWFISKESYD